MAVPSAADMAAMTVETNAHEDTNLAKVRHRVSQFNIPTSLSLDQQVNLYLNMSQVMKRTNASTRMSKKQFQDFIASAETSVGMKMKVSYHVVPKQQFEVLLQNKLIPPEAIIDMDKLVLPSNHDWSSVRLVDKMVARHTMGPGVYEAEFYHKDYSDCYHCHVVVVEESYKSVPVHEYGAPATPQDAPQAAPQAAPAQGSRDGSPCAKRPCAGS
eukprot:2911804-Amphidinium_carterae.1